MPLLEVQIKILPDVKSIRTELFGQVVVQLERVLHDQRRVGGHRAVLAGLDVEGITGQSLTTFSRKLCKKNRKLLLLLKNVF